MLLYKTIPYIFIFLIASLLNCALLLVSILPLQVAPPDTSKSNKANRIKIEQSGNNNSVSINQKSHSLDGRATINVTGEHNKVTITTNNQVLRAKANYRGQSNILLWKPAYANQFFSIHLSAGLKSSNSTNNKLYYFYFDSLDEDLFLFQNTDSVEQIYQKRP